MADLDLVPGEYRRGMLLRRWLRRFGVIYLAILVCVVTAKVGFAYGVRNKVRQVEEVRAARALEQAQRTRLSELRAEKLEASQHLSVLTGLRGGVAAKQMFGVIDRAMDGSVWFIDWKFRRAGELVENRPEAVQTGYFIVIPVEKQEQGEKAWLMRTHMEIRAQAFDHSALARFVRRLVEQPEIEEARVLSTRTHRYTASEVVDFELAVVVRTRA